MPFATVAVPFDAFRNLPSPQARWLLTCLIRYADRSGCCWPSMRQLAQDARMSLASVCRYLKSMADLGVFQRVRRGVGRYRYQLADAYVPRWPGKGERRVSRAEHHVPPAENREAKQHSNKKPEFVDFHDSASQWRARLAAWASSGGRFWNPFWGPKPNEAGYWGPRTAT